MGKPIAIFVGTRPEVIKLAPVCLELRSRGAPFVVYSVRQQAMAERYLLEKGIYSCPIDLSRTSSDLLELFGAGFTALNKVRWTDFSTVVVHGDTSTALMAGLAANSQRIPVAHVEAGLRTTNKYRPFPEEINRRLLATIADIHFAPTPTAVRRLKDELIAGRMVLSGNTGIDAYYQIPFESSQIVDDIVAKAEGRPIVLVTCHRRESWDLIPILVKSVFSSEDDICIVWPVHPNPSISRSFEGFSASHVQLISPLDHSDLIRLLRQSALVATDSVNY